MRRCAPSSSRDGPRARSPATSATALGSFQVLCHHFRRDSDPVFFVSPRPGPRDQPKKSAARDLIVELRKRNYSVYEISESLKERKLSLKSDRGARGAQGRGIRASAAARR